MKCKKVPYNSEGEAEFILNTIIVKNKQKNKKVPTRTYLCDFCNKWHITSMSDKVKRKHDKKKKEESLHNESEFWEDRLDISKNIKIKKMKY